MDVKYAIVLPENQKAIYTEYDNVDFKISNVGRKLVGGSVRLLGDVKVSENENLTQLVAYDGFVGAHSYVDSITTSFAKTGQIENIRSYARYVSATAKAKLCKEDLINSAYVCENRVVSDKMASNLLKGVHPLLASRSEEYASATTTKLDFATKLDFCLNNMVGDAYLPYEKTGDITISIQIPRTVSVLYGESGIGSGKKIELENLRISYTTVADDGKYAPKYLMRVKTDIKQSIQSTNSAISTKVPIVADCMFMTFVQQANENKPLHNGMACEVLPTVNRVEFLWNDSFSQEFVYQLDNQEEILTNYIKAINKGTVGTNHASLNVLASNDAYGLGLYFGQYLDLSKSKIGVNIQSGVSSSTPYTAYMFFSGVVEV